MRHIRQIFEIITIVLLICSCANTHDTNIASNDHKYNNTFKAIEVDAKDLEYIDSTSDNMLDVDDMYGVTSDIFDQPESEFIETDETQDNMKESGEFEYIYNINENDIDSLKYEDMPLDMVDCIRFGYIDENDCKKCYMALASYLGRDNIDNIVKSDWVTTKSYGDDVYNIIVWKIDEVHYKCVLTNDNIYITKQI